MIKTIRDFVRAPEGSPVVFTPVGCVRRHSHGSCAPIHVAVMFEDEEGRRVTYFYPGETGHESFHLKGAKGLLSASRRSFVPKKGMFGPTRWEDQKWSLCAGSSTYATLTVTYGELQEAIDILETRLNHAVVRHRWASVKAKPGRLTLTKAGRALVAVVLDKLWCDPCQRWRSVCDMCAGVCGDCEAGVSG